MVNQVPVVSIMMIVNGSLTCLLGAILAILGPAFLSLIAMDGGPPMRGEDRQILTWLSMVYVVMGVLLLLAGILNIAGGIRALKYRNRGLVITALFFNLIPIFTVYCTPTSLGLIIYGLIVMFNRDVSAAFAMGASGMPADEIRARLDPNRRWRMQQEQFDSYGEPRQIEEFRRNPPPPAEPGDTGVYRQD